MVSSMRGTPVHAMPDGHLIDVRTGVDLGPAADEDDTVEQHDEGFFFGGYVAFDFNQRTRMPSGVRVAVPNARSPRPTRALRIEHDPRSAFDGAARPERSPSPALLQPQPQLQPPPAPPA